MGSIIGIRKGTEEVPYDVVESRGSFEIRSYGERIVIETLLHDSGKLTESHGFRTLANYIFGQNDKHEKIAMTAPVEVRPNERCASMSPGSDDMKQSLLQETTGGGMIMRFTLPHKLKEDQVPKPLNHNVNVATVVPQKFATLRFTGAWTEASFREHAELLLEEVKQSNKYRPFGDIISWRYDPPWTISCFRRNEVAVELTSASSSADESALAVL